MSNVTTLRDVTFTPLDGAHGHPPVPCPACGQVMDAAQSVSLWHWKPPVDSDWSVCFECGEVSIYVVGDFGVALRTPTLEELVVFNEEHPGIVQQLHLFNSQQRGR